MADFDTYAAFAAIYADVDDAKADYDGIKALYYDLNLVDTFDAAVIEKGDDGKVRIVAKHEQPTRDAAWLGGGVGLAAGLVAAIFPAIGIGAAILAGTGIGAGLGALAGHAAGGMSRSDLKDLGELLDAGQAALVAVAAVDVEARVEALLKRAEKIEKKQLNADEKQLEADLTAAEKQAASAGDA